MKKLTITECRKFLKDSNNNKYINIYNLIDKYVNKYDNQESQYMIQTSQSYRDRIDSEKKQYRVGGKLLTKNEFFNKELNK